MDDSSVASAEIDARVYRVGTIQPSPESKTKTPLFKAAAIPVAKPPQRSFPMLKRDGDPWSLRLPYASAAFDEVHWCSGGLLD